MQMVLYLAAGQVLDQFDYISAKYYIEFFVAPTETGLGMVNEKLMNYDELTLSDI